jgi:hypothetical protein
VKWFLLALLLLGVTVALAMLMPGCATRGEWHQVTVDVVDEKGTPAAGATVRMTLDTLPPIMFAFVLDEVGTRQFMAPVNGRAVEILQRSQRARVTSQCVD